MDMPVQDRKNTPDGEDIDFVFIAKMLVRNWRILLLCVAISLAFAYLHLSLARVQYWAATDAPILYSRPGAVAAALACDTLSSTQTRFDASAKAGVTDPANCENFINPDWGPAAFVDPVVAELGWQGTRDEQLLRQTFDAQYINPRNLMVFSARGFGEENAAAAVRAAVTVLRRFQDDQGKLLVATYEEVIARITAGIAETDALLAQLDSLLERGQPGSPIEEFLLERFRVEEYQRLNALRGQKDVMEQSFGDVVLQAEPAALTTNVRTTYVYPRSRRVWTFAAVTGFLAGILVIAFNATKRQTINRAGTGPD